MQLTARQEKLFEFVKKQHGNQVRKYTGEPYYNHLYSVASIVSEYEIKQGVIEIALCHDLFEDTGCHFHQLSRVLYSIGYSPEVVRFIIRGVFALTDQYVTEKYPHLNRERRKTLEAKRLGGIDPIYQSIKYADLIDNTSSIVERDAKFAVHYLREKKEILSIMTYGNPMLHSLASEICEQTF